MLYSLSIIGLVLAYMWIGRPLFGAQPTWSAMTIVGILGVCAYGNAQHGNLRHGSLWDGASWGFRRRDFLPGLRRALWLTLPAVALVLAVGLALGTFQMKDDLLVRFLLLLAWGLMQQFVLQTVIYREARERYSRGTATMIAASLFALVHLPNPFLVPATFAAALAWCRIYEDHPNLLPLAFSHAAMSGAASMSLGEGITGGMRVGYGYLLANGIWL
jgi:membrane protease YdiL (CAAX protease family)